MLMASRDVLDLPCDPRDRAVPDLGSAPPFKVHREREMSMSVYETDLPGVGKKFEIEIGGDERLVIVTHNTGRREVYLKPQEDADAEKLFEVSDRLARKIGSILEGAYFQPIRTDVVETMLAEGTVLEWYSVEEGAPLAGRTLGDAHVRERTGASVIAIERQDEILPSPTADRVIEVGDTLIVIGSGEAISEFESLVSGNMTERQ